MIPFSIFAIFEFLFQIKYRDVPGVDISYLAMDSEEGVEVVWNEANISTNKKFSPVSVSFFLREPISFRDHSSEN